MKSRNIIILKIIFLAILTVATNFCNAQNSQEVPSKGYKLTWFANHEKHFLVLKKFQECDSLYYLSYYINGNNRYYHYMFVSEELKDYIISCTSGMSKNEKKMWGKTFLNETEFAKINRTKGYNKFWIKYNQPSTSVTGNVFQGWNNLLNKNHLSLNNAINNYRRLRSRKTSLSDLTATDIAALALGLAVFKDVKGYYTSQEKYYNPLLHD